MNSMELRGARARLGLSQKNVAEALGITPQTYCNKENGVSEFSLTEAAKLASLLELTAGQVNDYLFDGSLPAG